MLGNSEPMNTHCLQASVSALGNIQFESPVGLELSSANQNITGAANTPGT